MNKRCYWVVRNHFSGHPHLNTRFPLTMWPLPFLSTVPGSLRTSRSWLLRRALFPFLHLMWALQGLASSHALLSTLPLWAHMSLASSSDQYWEYSQTHIFAWPITSIQFPVSTPSLAVSLHSNLYLVIPPSLETQLFQKWAHSLYIPHWLLFPLSVVLAPTCSVFE